MSDESVELAELRRRLERLEDEFAAWRNRLPDTGDLPSGMPPPLRTMPVRAETPPPPAPPPAGAPTLVERVQAVSSTVWIAGAGAGIFLLGAIYGLTVSIQRGWVSPPMRVGAGLVTGLLAGGAALRLLVAGRRELGVTFLAVGAGTWTFALYFGAKVAHLFPLGLGFAGAALATLGAGAVAARFRSDAVMAVALAVGLAAPLAFSDGTGSLPGLLAYLLALLAAQLVAHYVTGAGSGWKVARVLGSGGVWIVALLGAGGARLGEIALGFTALGALTMGGLVLAWLPRHRERAEAPAAVATLVLVLSALATWQVWRRAHLEREDFAAILVGYSLVSAGLLQVHRRLGRQDGETALALLAAGFGLLAVPTAIAWRWVALAWGLGALLLALGTRVGKREAAGGALAQGAAVVTGAATLVWLAQALGHSRADLIFLNPVFVGAALTAAAWGALAGGDATRRMVAWGAAQAVGVNALAWEFSRAVGPVQSGEVNLALGPVLATLTYAGVGAALWLRGVVREADEARARAGRLAGYLWLVVAAVKLLAFDLGGRDLLFRAVAALGVGAVFIGAAWWADRHRSRRGASG